jgi:monofunctional biosynthetic peptidoglycan transglycosylase
MTSDRKQKKQNLRIMHKFIKIIARLLLCFIIFSIFIVLHLRWINPVTSAVMITRHITNKDKKHPVKFKWADWKDISPYMPLAVIAAEDQKFFYHYGFDVQAILRAIEDNNKKSQLKGASTITQQVAKNLFLWKKKAT